MTGTIGFQPLGDLILVREVSTIHDGLIQVPESVEGKYSHQPGDYQDGFIGEVVAVGPGDRLLYAQCRGCHGIQSRVLDRYRRKQGHFGGFGACPSCQTSDWELVGESRLAMQCQVGDRVIYPRRPSSPGGDSDIKINGERFLMFHEEQWAFALLEE